MAGMFFKPAIRVKLTFWFSCIISVLLIIVAHMLYSQGRETLKQEIIQKIGILADYKAADFENYWREKEKIIKILSTRPFILEAVEKLNRAFKAGLDSSEYAAVDEQIRPVLLSYKYGEGFKNFLLVSWEGDVVFSLNRDQYLGINLKKGLHRYCALTRLLDSTGILLEPGISDFEYHPEIDEAADFIAAPLIQAGKISGFAVFQLDAQEMNALAEDYRGLGNTGEILIGAKTGDKVIFIAPTRYDRSAALKREDEFVSGKDNFLTQAVEGTRGQGVGYDYRGKQVVAAWRHIPSFHRGLAVKIDTDEAYAPIQKLKKRILLILIWAVLTGICASFLTVRLILARFYSLYKGIEIINAGDLSYRIAGNSQDEIGYLSRAFDDMVYKLKNIITSRDELNKEIEQREKAEELIRRLAAIVDSSDDAIIGKDLNGIITSWNMGAEKIYGYTAQEAIGKPISILVPGDRPDEIPDFLRKIRNGEVVTNLETVRVCKNGKRIYVSFTSSLIKDREGNIIGASTIARDITERKKAEVELQEAKIKAEVASRAKSDFLSNMSHELRTPLTSIIGFSQILEGGLFGTLNAKQKEHMKYILTSAHHLLSLINDILDLAKVEAGKMEFLPSMVRLKEVLFYSVMILSEKAKSQELALNLDMGPQTEIEFETDERKLKQIMFNLLSNAIKFTSGGGIVQVIVRKPDDNTIEISVADTGIGIKQEDMPKLFQEFTQLRNGLENKSVGTGLGLALTKKLVDVLGGKITVESEYGKGTTFRFTLPVRR